MFNKKGLELSMNFIIIAALALIVLIIGAIFFMGGFREIGSSIEETTGLSQQELTLAETVCKSACSFNSKSQWDNPVFSEGVIASNYCNNDEDCNCEDLMGSEYRWPSSDECLSPGETE